MIIMIYIYYVFLIYIILLFDNIYMINYCFVCFYMIIHDCILLSMIVYN